MARYSNGNLWRKQYARIKARHDDCGICHKAIDYSLPSGHPMGFEVDHIVPISKGGAVYDMDNLQASHRECNRIKSDHMACTGNVTPPLEHSRDWSRVGGGG